MTVGWFIVASMIAPVLLITASHLLQAVIYSLFPRLTFIPCLAIAACLTSTDPIISAAIVGTLVPVCLDIYIDHHRNHAQGLTFSHVISYILTGNHTSRNTSL